MKRAVGIVRVSQVAGREGDSFASPSIQAERIKNACERDGLTLVAVHEELDISGGRPLAQRPGLSAAVTDIEEGRAEVVAAAYFDRLFRSLTTQAEVIERVESAGGQVITVDVGRVTNGSSAQWLSGTMHGMMAEYFRRQSGEKSASAQERAIARGVAIGPVPPGYVRGPGKVYVIDPDVAPIVQEAFRLRAEGASVAAVRSYLAEHGIHRTESGVRKMFSSRLYLGEIHYGDFRPNLNAHEPLIDPETFRKAHGMIVSPGRKAKSKRLFARLGVLRCGSCGSKMVVGSQVRNGKQCYPFYYCQSRDCVQRVSIQAHIAEDHVAKKVKTALQDAQGRASMAESAQEAVSALSRAQDDLDAALRVFTLTGAENESAAVERLAELRKARDEARARVDQIGPSADDELVDMDEWDTFPLDLKRNLIRRAVERATVLPGARGAGRISVELRG